MTAKTARIQRNPIVFHKDSPPANDFPMWIAWSDRLECTSHGNAVAYGMTRKECERNARWQGYETRVWLRAGDNGKERRHPTNNPTFKQRLTNLIRAA